MSDDPSWYYFEGGERRGPVTEEALRESIREGGLSENVLTWTEGMRGWTPARKVEALSERGSPPAGRGHSGHQEGGGSQSPEEALPEGNFDPQASPDLHSAPDQLSASSASEKARGSVPSGADEKGAGDNLSARRAYAGLGRRAGAALLDMGFFALTMAAVGALAPKAAAAQIEGSIIAMRTASLLVGWAYFAGFEASRWQATPGKCLLGLRVRSVGAGRGSGRVPFRWTAARQAGKVLSLGTLLIGFLAALLTSKKQSLHDFLAGTVVVESAV